MSPFSSAGDLDQVVSALGTLTGIDPGHFVGSCMKVRLTRISRNLGILDFGQLARRMKEDSRVAGEILEHFTIGTRDLFRDPLFFRSLRSRILPDFRTTGLKAWIPFVSRGGEAYSLSRVLLEEGIMSRSMIYATDPNPGVLALAKRGRFDGYLAGEFESSWIKSGGNREMGTLFEVQGEWLEVNRALSGIITFMDLNCRAERPPMDGIDLILFRNVLLSMRLAVRRELFDWICGALRPGGCIALGYRENLSSIPGSVYTSCLKAVDEKQGIFRLEEER